MSINHYADENIDPKLDAYAKDVYVDTLSLAELSIDTADVKVKTTFGEAEDINTNNTITEGTGLELLSLEASQTINSAKLTSDTLKVNNLFSSFFLDSVTTLPFNKVGVSNPNNINIKGLSNIVPTYISGNPADYTNCAFDLIPSTSYDWLYTQSRIERSLVIGSPSSEVKQIRRVRFNINMKSTVTQEPGKDYFVIPLLDSDVTPSNTFLVSCMGTCSAPVSVVTANSYITGLEGSPFQSTEVGNGKIFVAYGNFNLFPSNADFIFTLDLEYIVSL